MNVSLRPFLTLSALPLIVACSAAPAGPDQSADAIAGASSVKDWDRAVTRPASESDADQQRRACAFKRGAMPAETLGAELAVDKDLPVKTIVVLMQENRSFDSYFGHLAKYAATLGVNLDIEAATDDASNPEDVTDPASPTHPWQHAANLCLSDTNHEWYGSHLEWNDGAMNGFFQANQGFTEKGEPTVDASLLSGERALWWYDETDIPFYYELASTFAIGDHYHSSVIGPTWPNRDYLYAASSWGATTNYNPTCEYLSNFVCLQTAFNGKDVVIFDELTKRKVNWAIYVDGNTTVPEPRLGAFLTPAQLTTRMSHIGRMTEFFTRAANGTLPPVVFLDGDIKENSEGNDEHPPGDIQKGQKLSSDVIHAMMKSPQWGSSVLFLTYDEHGGIYDHVAPPPACAPDAVAPEFWTDEDKAYQAQHPGTTFDHYGFRVPITVVSPFAKKSYVSHHTYDHTSITRFIEAVFKVPALTARDANADAMYDFFDFENPPFATPPDLSEATVDQARLDECRALYPKDGPQN